MSQNPQVNTDKTDNSEEGRQSDSDAFSKLDFIDSNVLSSI